MSDNRFLIINIREYLALGTDEEAGEPALVKLLSGFSCPQNKDVEYFLKENAIEFTKKSQSVTYLIFSNKDGALLGYFSLTLKPLIVKGTSISKTISKKLQRISQFNKETGTYTMSAYLIAQLGKNFSNDLNKRITGEELINLAMNTIKEVQYKVGGIVVFLEANDKEKLKLFYEERNFKEFDSRMTFSRNGEEYKLLQYLKVL